MKKNSKKKKLLAAAAALALIAAISGTFAWITAQDQRINRAESAAVNDNSVTVKETWEPKPLVPGTEATKEVAVSNTGTASVFVRVSYEEVLKHLEQLGAEKYDSSSVAGAKYTYVANDSGLNKHMPISFNGDQAYKDGFVLVDASQVTGLTAADANVKLLVKGGKTIEPVTDIEKISYEAKLVHEYFTHPDNVGKNPGATGYDASKNSYQSMTFDITVSSENSSLSAADWNFAVTNVKYGYYENGYKNTAVNWAESSLPDEDGNATGRALLGTDGVRYSVDYDYTFGGLGFATAGDLPGVTPAALPDQIPTAAGNKGVQADVRGLNNESHIRIGYSADITDTTTLDNEKWVYNADDGWFYYTVPVKSGETTKNLLEKLIYEKDMGVEYTNASYDLVVKMEAVQANAEALTDSAGWNLGGGSAPTGDTLLIVNKLKAGV